MMMPMAQTNGLTGKGSAPMRVVSLTARSAPCCVCWFRAALWRKLPSPSACPCPDAERLLAGLQSRCGVSSFTRLLVLAVLNAWV